MDPLDQDSMKAISDNLKEIVEADEKEAERHKQEELERQNKQKEKELREQEEVEGVKTFVRDLADNILRTNQFAEWKNPEEEDRGENYLAIEKDLTDNIKIYLWPNTIGCKFNPFALEEIITAPLARMIKRRFGWIVANNIQPSVGSRY